MVKVLGFFAGKKAGPTPEKSSEVKKLPVIVVCSGKFVPKVVRTDKESLGTHVEGNLEPVFNDVNSQKTRLTLDEGIKEDVMLHQSEPIKKKVSDEAFEEEIREIDKGIKKYGRILTVPPRLGVNIEKENALSQPYIYEQQVPCPTAHAANVLGLAVHAAQLSPSTHMPLAKIPSSLVNHMHPEGTWKRFTRIGVTTDVSMAEIVGGKRSAENTTNQSELPKKRRVSQGGATKK